MATGQVGSPDSGGETRGAPAAASGDADRDATQSVGTVPEATWSVAAGGEESRSVGPEDQSSEPTGTGGEAGAVPDGDSPPVDVAASAGPHGSAEHSSSQAADLATGAPTPTGAGTVAGVGVLRASAPTTGAATADSWSAEVAADRAATAAGVTGLGALLAGGLMLVWRERRVQQLWSRPVGRRILHPGADGQRFETALGVQAATGLTARVDALLRDDATTPLVGAGSMLVIENDHVRVGARTLPLPDEPSTATVRLPAVVTLGSDDAGRHILVDLEREGALRVGGPAADYRRLALTMALELGCAPWAGSASTTIIGEVPAHVLAGVENVRVTGDVGGAIAAAVSLATVRRTELTSRAWTLAEARTGHDAVDAWAPEVLIFLEPLADAERERLDRALVGLPVGIAAVLPVDASAAVAPADAPADLTIGAGVIARPDGPVVSVTDGPILARPDGPVVALSEGPIVTVSDGPVLTLTDGTVITPQLLTDATIPAIADLMTTTAGTDTTEAFWSGVPGGRGGFAQEVIPVGHRVSPGATEFSYPTLMLLGPIELIGAAGTPPPKAARSCLEYCGWLLEHPGTTASQMASALIVAEGTRRSNMSRLRTWLGTSPDGTVYLPDAYSGRIYLDSSVGSDWYRLQLLVSSGITEVSRETLIDALSLVRGAPLADAAPGQWHWAEELRTDIVSLVRDIGVVLAESAVASGDLDLARWATARALTVAGEDELLVCARIRTEHRAGNRPEVERLVLRLTTHARRLGVDLDPETVTLLQEVIEGRLRSRA